MIKENNRKYLIKNVKKKYSLHLYKFLNELNQIKFNLKISIDNLNKLESCKNEYYTNFEILIKYRIDNNKLNEYYLFLLYIHNVIHYQKKYIDSLKSKINDKIKVLNKNLTMLKGFNILIKKIDLKKHHVKIKNLKKLNNESVINLYIKKLN